MAIINCSECYKEISDKASQCVHCGAPRPHQSKRNSDSVLVDHSLPTPNTVGETPCEFCSTPIPDKATVCRGCGAEWREGEGTQFLVIFAIAQIAFGLFLMGDFDEFGGISVIFLVGGVASFVAAIVASRKRWVRRKGGGFIAGGFTSGGGGGE